MSVRPPSGPPDRSTPASGLALSTLAIGAVVALVLAASFSVLLRDPAGPAAIAPVEDPVSSPAGAGSDAPPAAPDPPDAAMLYQTHCVLCHGKEGRGDGPLAASLPVIPANILEHLDHHTEDELVQLIVRGIRPAMPPTPLGEEEARQLVLYLQSLRPY